MAAGTMGRSASLDDLKLSKSGPYRHGNVGQSERLATALGGGALALYGLTRGDVSGKLMALAGGGLVYRAATGYCPAYGALGIDRTVETEYPKEVQVEAAVTINREAQELYGYWRNLENLPHIMSHLESVRDLGGGRSHWVAKAPAGRQVEWDAEIINDEPGRLIAWRSLEGSDIVHAGTVRFERATGGRGTVVRVTLNYNPPAGQVGRALALLFKEEPGIQIDDDLRRFKQLMEAGEIATVEGQPSGRGDAPRMGSPLPRLAQVPS